MFFPQISAYFTGKGHRHNPLEFWTYLLFKKEVENQHNYSTLLKSTFDNNTQHFQLAPEARNLSEPLKLTNQIMPRKLL